MSAYLDSSFLFSLYVLDAHSADANRQARRSKQQLVISALGELELLNALELRVFRGELDRDQVQRAQALYDQDLSSGLLQMVEIGPATYVRARELIFETSATLGCRTADILHVAAALQMGATRLLTFDDRQKAVARRMKLPTNA